MKRAIFPGSFDPITLGHYDLIKRSIPLFDEIVIAVGTNSKKKYMFSLKTRMDFIEETFEGHNSLVITNYEGLTIDFCNKCNADFKIAHPPSSGVSFLVILPPVPRIDFPLPPLRPG